ncbi:hypothetical protein H0A43_03440 [Arcobacter lanthieri]|uniref:hypothetical protein n=1 Tax=Aliarcobacter lanthieri TaxID=1355374 RepID=UPI001922C4A7|nr:hypothetical protein [Aliarcobacter lanthieri]MBL3519511.1 hypothetical protein [Aliarcobacter lanthieri]
MKTKNLICTLFIASFFAGCSATLKSVEKTQLTVANEVSNKELFENKENWQPINKDQILQNIKNEKVVK